MTEEETKTKKEVSEELAFKLVEVTTQTAPAIQTPEGEFISEAQALVTILNEVKSIKKLIG